MEKEFDALSLCFVIFIQMILSIQKQSQSKQYKQSQRYIYSFFLHICLPISVMNYIHHTISSLGIDEKSSFILRSLTLFPYDSFIRNCSAANSRYRSWVANNV